MWNVNIQLEISTDKYYWTTFDSLVLLNLEVNLTKLKSFVVFQYIFDFQHKQYTSD